MTKTGETKEILIPKWIYLVVICLIIGGWYFVIPKISLPQQQSQEILQLQDLKNYKLILVNQSSHTNYLDSYRQILIKSGYLNVEIDETNAYPRSQLSMVMFNETDSLAGNKIVELLKQTYGTVLTSPIPENTEHKIIIILTDANSL